MKQSELRRDESGALAHRATAFDLPTADKGYYTYYDLYGGSKSCIDHFSVHYSLCDSILGVERVSGGLTPCRPVGRCGGRKM